MTRFGGRFERFPFDDHSPPPLGLLYYFCESAHEWLSSHKDHVIAVHCKAGKGRTGTCISAYFLYARLYRTPAEAMEAYGSARTKNKKGVTIPSQRRFVEYFGHCCERRHVVDLDSVYTTHRFRDEDLGGRGWGAPCDQLLDQAWNARWRRQATDCPAPPRRVLMLKGVRSTVGLVDVTCGSFVYRDLGGRLTKTVPLTEEVRVSIKGKKGLRVLVPLFVCGGLYFAYYETGPGQGLEGQGLPGRRRGRINVWAAHDKILCPCPYKMPTLATVTRPRPAPRRRARGTRTSQRRGRVVD